MEVPGQLVDLGLENLIGGDPSRPRYDKVAEGFGCFGAYVEDPAEIGPALSAAVKSGLPAGSPGVVGQGANGRAPGRRPARGGGGGGAPPQPQHQGREPPPEAACDVAGSAAALPTNGLLSTPSLPM